jgi:hypothetical protein
VCFYGTGFERFGQACSWVSVNILRHKVSRLLFFWGGNFGEFLMNGTANDFDGRFSQCPL